MNPIVSNTERAAPSKATQKEREAMFGIVDGMVFDYPAIPDTSRALALLRQHVVDETAKLRKQLEEACLDWAEDDTRIKALAKPFGIDTEGDSYGVPSMVDVVEKMAAALKLAQGDKDRLRNALVAIDGLKDGYRALASVILNDPKLKISAETHINGRSVGTIVSEMAVHVHNARAAIDSARGAKEEIK